MPIRDRMLAVSFKEDIKASVTVFLVALPLCLGISLASGTSLLTGLTAGIVGGMVVPLISRSPLSVSGPAAGLTTISATAITQLGSLDAFFVAVALAGLLQIVLGFFRLGNFTQLIPSSVIRGMLAAIGLMLMAKQIPFMIGYERPEFWEDTMINLLMLRHGVQRVSDQLQHLSNGAMIISAFCIIVILAWEKYLAAKVPLLPASFVTVVAGSLLAFLMQAYSPQTALTQSQFVRLPEPALTIMSLHYLSTEALTTNVWFSAIIICLVASLETLLSIEAVDKIDPQKRATPKNRELVAQGVGNFTSAIFGGLPITSVIVRSAANTEAGAKSSASSFSHGLWLLLTVMFAAPVVKHIPYCVLAVILVRTGYGLIKPAMVKAVYKQGREQFLPFIVTVVAIVASDLLLGIAIGIAAAVYFLIRHTYRAGFKLRKKLKNGADGIRVELALNVSFLNKKRFSELFAGIPENSVVEIDGSRSIYVDHDILEILYGFKTTAPDRNIKVTMNSIPPVIHVGGH